MQQLLGLVSLFVRIGGQVRDSHAVNVNSCKWVFEVVIDLFCLLHDSEVHSSDLAPGAVANKDEFG